MAFDPDLYLKEKAGVGDAAAPFDPDAYLKSKAPPSWLDMQLPMGTTPRGIIQGGLNALPMAGMVAGGALGTPGDVVTGPAGTVVGAGLGAAGGQTLKEAGERFLLGKDKPNSEVLKNVALAVPEGMAGEMGGQALGKGAEMAAGTKLGQAIISKAGSAAARVGEVFTGVPKAEIETYAKNAPEINKMSSEADHNVQDMADSAREKINATIVEHKAVLNDQISQSLKGNTSKIDSAPILEKLNAEKAKINATLRPEEVGQVDELIGKVKDLSKDGQLSIQDAHDLKEYLQESAKGTYQKGGQIFQMGSKAAGAAKSAGGVTRALLNDAAPEIASANESLSKLHDIQDVMNKSMLTEGKSAGPIMAAGSGANPANEKILRQLGEETGEDILGEAQKLSAARTFGKPQLMPVDSTGKAAGRVGLAALIGFATGGPAGAATAAAMTSPAALKVAIDTGRALGTPTAMALSRAAMKAAIQQGIKLPDSVDVPTPGAPLSPDNSLTKKPLKGPDKWANDGHQQLLKHVEGDPEAQNLLEKSKQQMLADPKQKDLLIQASDLKPGSKAMEAVLSKVKAKAKIASDE